MIGRTVGQRWISAVFLGMLLCLLCREAVAQQSPPNLYLVNANVLDGVSPDVMLGATVITADGKIDGIVRGEVTPPPGAEIIDLQGRYLVPGLIDAHSHVNDLAGVRRALESGVTTIRTAGVGGFADVGIRDLVKQGYLQGPDIVTTGIFVTPDIGGAVLWDERLYDLHLTGVETEDELRRLVRINIDHGVDWIKTRTTDRAGLAERDPRTLI